MQLLLNQIHPCCMADFRRINAAIANTTIIATRGNQIWEVTAILYVSNPLRANDGHLLNFGINLTGNDRDAAFIGPLLPARDALQCVGGCDMLRPDLTDQLIENANQWLRMTRLADLFQLQEYAV